MTATPLRVPEPPAEALCLLTSQGRVRYTSFEFDRITGCGPSAPTDRSFLDFAHPDDRASVLEGLNAARSTKQPLQFACRLGSTDGPYHECTLHLEAAGDQLFAVARERAESDAPQIQQLALESSPCATVVVDAEGTIALANHETERLFGYPEGALRGQTVEILVPEQARSAHVQYRKNFAESATAYPMGKLRDLMGQRRDGSLFAVEVGLVPFRTSEGAYVVAGIADLTTRREIERRVTQQAEMLEYANARLTELTLTDHLTKLHNRRAFLDQLEVQLEQAARTARSLSLLILDIDHFKEYNDQFGHLAGDDVLRGVADVLRARARRSDYAGRIGGEEFGVILPETDHDGALLSAERFRVAIEERSWPLREVTASVGATTVAFATARPRPQVPGYSPVIARADRALYHAKDTGRNRVAHADDIAPADRA
jgi:diguanylate cyclase (GGDEF)-like protein/PAS domain S-box-containing protein